MKVRITRAQLLSQLPEKSGYALIQWLDAMPPFFEFEAVPVEEFHSKLWPEYESVLTPIEAGIFARLEREGSVSDHLIQSFCYAPRQGISILSNKAQVHMMNLRRKLPAQLRVRRVRSSHTRPGRYVLEPAA